MPRNRRRTDIYWKWFSSNEFFDYINQHAPTTNDSNEKKFLISIFFLDQNRLFDRFFNRFRQRVFRNVFTFFQFSVFYSCFVIYRFYLQLDWLFDISDVSLTLLLNGLFSLRFIIIFLFFNFHRLLIRTIFVFIAHKFTLTQADDQTTTVYVIVFHRVQFNWMQ